MENKKIHDKIEGIKKIKGKELDKLWIGGWGENDGNSYKMSGWQFWRIGKENESKEDLRL